MIKVSTFAPFKVKYIRDKKAKILQVSPIFFIRIRCLISCIILENVDFIFKITGTDYDLILSDKLINEVKRL